MKSDWLAWLWRSRDVRPFPSQWRFLFESSLPHYHGLSPELRERFESQVQRFLAGKRFYGCNGLEVTEDMRVLVAGLACLLILRPDAKVFPNLRSVLLYPTAFWVRHEEPDEIGVVHEGEVLQVGESQDWGRVVLSWEDVEAALAGDAVNVVAHEFAHQLDVGAGAPNLPDYARWSRVMQEAYDELCAKGSPVLDAYGAEGPAEFFAVATESYFQRGEELRSHHPELYVLLKDYYLLETA
ncbi:MAG: zinc-dependent peptidase [Nevskiales bacterium]|nr:zinc-dependent peptidase [Nevskiales bacterium]